MVSAPLTREELRSFLRAHKLVVLSSLGPDGAPQAAVVGYAVSDALELVFDTLTSTRKYRNLRADPRAALVVFEGERTVQLEGTVDFPEGDELERLRNVYFGPYPDGRERLAWTGITHGRVTLTWARLSDYAVEPPRIVELAAEAFR
ncbi:MAG TPA: pyridoxamine 5'-phosphate oxidase family protein [Polyangiaceae bacterium]|nr:pyridoxamine 5'-phosphate oxidase family protein [Polyangiaceae bacterium]